MSTSNIQEPGAHGDCIADLGVPQPAEGSASEIRSTPRLPRRGRISYERLLPLSGRSLASPTDEIEGLLRYVANLDGASFIRGMAVERSVRSAKDINRYSGVRIDSYCRNGGSVPSDFTISELNHIEYWGK